MLSAITREAGLRVSHEGRLTVVREDRGGFSSGGGEAASSSASASSGAASAPLSHTFAEKDHLTRVYTAVCATPEGISPVMFATGCKDGSVQIFNQELKLMTRMGGGAASSSSSSNASTSAGVTCMAFGPKASTLFASYASDGTVFATDVVTGRETGRISVDDKPLSCLVFHRGSSSNSYLAAGWTSIKVFGMSSSSDESEGPVPTTTIRYTGHTSRINCLAFSHDSNLLFSGAEQDRFVNVWPGPEAVLRELEREGDDDDDEEDAEEADDDDDKRKKDRKKSKKKKKKIRVRAPLLQLSVGVPTYPRSLSYSNFGNTTHFISAVLNSGKVSIWKFEENDLARIANGAGEGLTTISPACVVESDAVVACALVHNNSNSTRSDGVSSTTTANKSRVSTKSGKNKSKRKAGEDDDDDEDADENDAAEGGAAKTALVMVKDLSRLIRVPLTDPATGFLVSNIELSRVIKTPPSTVAMNGTVSSSTSTKPTTKTKTEVLDRTASSAVVRRARSSSSSSSSSSLNGEQQHKGDESVPPEDLPLIERLAAISNRLKSISSNNTSSSSSTTLSSSTTATTTTTKMTAGSMAQALEQALQTSDNEKIESVIQTGDQDVIRRTVAKLSDANVGRLLSQLAKRIASKPNRNAHLLSWVSGVLQVASPTALRENETAVEALRAIYHISDARVATFPHFLRLKGRLDAALARGPSSSSSSTDAALIPSYATGSEKKRSKSAGTMNGTASGNPVLNGVNGREEKPPLLVVNVSSSSSSAAAASNPNKRRKRENADTAAA